MAAPPASAVASFNRLLRLAGESKHRQLRCVWGATDYGLDRWVIQCHLPNDIHAQCLQDFGTFHEERFIDKDILGAQGKVIGHYRFDMVNPWALIHIVQDKFWDLDDPRGYRMPSERDLAVIHHWMHDFETVAQQMRAVREANQKVEDKQRADRCYALADDIKNSRSLWELPEPMFVDAKDQMPGTELA